MIPEIELQSPEVINLFQERQLQKLIAYLADYSPYYKKIFEKEKISPEKIKLLSDLHNIPFTDKSHLQLFNNDFICIPRTKISDYITTSGTLGDPVTFALSDKDLDRLAYNECISFQCAGAKPGDVFQLMTTMDKRFMAGLAYFLGVRRMGSGIVRVGNGIPELQWDSIRRFSPKNIICVPSFILRVVKYAEENGIDYRNSSIKRAICIGENLRNQDFSLNLLGQRIKDKWDIELIATYSSTEMATTFPECSYGCGGHHHPELIITEVIDDNGNPVTDGEPGELVITTLGVEAMPLLRFRTGDLCTFHNEPCACGRKTKRISPIIGRKNQMIKYKGTTIFPSSIFDVLDHFDNVENYVVEVNTNDYGTDEVIVHVGSANGSDVLVKELKDKFRAKLRVTPEIKLTLVENIQKIQAPEKNRKPVKFLDKRKK
ncbi:MAG: AMP-binding protein [Bacteroidales bacterium]|nr:AMP-binding protein [Bacteroidales bacterium]